MLANTVIYARCVSLRTGQSAGSTPAACNGSGLSTLCLRVPKPGKKREGAVTAA